MTVFTVLVSWNLMIGKNARWVAKQHGHSIATMLRAYPAWAEGSVETDIETIKRPMELAPVLSVQANGELQDARLQDPKWETAVAIDNLAVDLPVAEVADRFCATAFGTIGRVGELISRRLRKLVAPSSWLAPLSATLGVT